MDKQLRQELNHILEGRSIRSVFQPIVSLRDGSVLGYEALSRITCASQIKHPEQLFALAEQSDCLWDLEQLCRTKALHAAFLSPHQVPCGRLFLNVNPNVMHDPKFREGFTSAYLQCYGIEPAAITFEITEREAVRDLQEFCKTISHYKKQDYTIAVDDVGSGFSNLNLLCAIRPHFMKLDRSLISGIDTDPLRYALVKSMLDFSRAFSAAVIAEGVETEAELETLVRLGVPYAQGYFLGRPDRVIRGLSPAVKSCLQTLLFRQNRPQEEKPEKGMEIGSICTRTPSLPPERKVEEVFAQSKKDPEAIGYCVVKNDQVQGILTKSNLLLQLSGPYGFSLHQNKQVASLMDRCFLTFDCHTPIRVVSQTAMSRNLDRLYDFVVVTKEGKYLGTVTVKDLLQKTTELEVRNARFQNPLTGLPGNRAIEHKMDACLESGLPYYVLYFDIDNFKAYNDAYGFAQGDRMIQFLAHCLRCPLPPEQFVGHVGGDDFVVVLTEGDPQQYCEEVIRTFTEGLTAFYSKEDYERKMILAENRHGVTEQFPLASLSAAGICDREHWFTSRLQLTEELAQLKKKSKQQIGNSCCIKEGPLAAKESLLFDAE